MSSKVVLKAELAISILLKSTQLGTQFDVSPLCLTFGFNLIKQLKALELI